jgi:hypothetical protein
VLQHALRHACSVARVFERIDGWEPVERREPNDLFTLHRSFRTRQHNHPCIGAKLTYGSFELCKVAHVGRPQVYIKRRCHPLDRM